MSGTGDYPHGQWPSLRVSPYFHPTAIGIWYGGLPSWHDIPLGSPLFRSDSFHGIQPKLDGPGFYPLCLNVNTNAWGTGASHEWAFWKS